MPQVSRAAVREAGDLAPAGGMPGVLMDAIFEFLHEILPPNAGEAFGTFVSAALTVMVFSYIAGDNLFFRLAQHVLIGCVAAYAVVVAVHSVLLANLLTPLLSDPRGQWPLLAPLMLGVLLLFKASPQTSRFGSISIAFMLGVGAALGIGGALLGTLLPQLQATMISFFDHLQVSMSPAEQLGLVSSNLLIVLGTLGAFLSFRFSAGRPGAIPPRSVGVPAAADRGSSGRMPTPLVRYLRAWRSHASPCSWNASSSCWTRSTLRYAKVL